MEKLKTEQFDSSTENNAPSKTNLRLVKTGGIAADQLNQLIARIERLEEDKAKIGEHIREVFAEAKYSGFDVKIIRQILRLRKLNPEQRQEQEYLLDLYKSAVGMSV